MGATMRQNHKGYSRRKFVLNSGMGVSGLAAASLFSEKTVVLWNSSKDPYQFVFQTFQKMFDLKDSDKALVDSFCHEFRNEMKNNGFSTESKLPVLEMDWESDLGKTLFHEFVTSTNVFETASEVESDLKRVRAPFFWYGQGSEQHIRA
jgi:hypothetical protein